MILNEFQKNLIRKIDNGEIFDFTSFSQVFMLSEEFQYDKSKIEQMFQEQEKNQMYYILKPGYDHGFSEIDQNSFIEQQALLDYSELVKSVNINGQDYKLDFTLPQRILSDTSKIKDFLAVIRYLRYNGLILSTRKELTSNDVSLFFSKVNKTKAREDQVLFHEKALLDEWRPNDLHHYFDGSDWVGIRLFPNGVVPTRSAFGYVDEDIIFNEDLFKLCNEIIDLSFSPTSELTTFILRKFKTRDERSNQINVITAWVAIGITFAFSIASLAFSIYTSKEEAAFNQALIGTLKEITYEVKLMRSQINENHSKLMKEIGR